jgi:hypothetical protein
LGRKSHESEQQNADYGLNQFFHAGTLPCPVEK